MHSDAVQHPRPQHLAWSGMVLDADDPWWQAHYPPNGWGCQCTVHALNQRDLERLGKSGPDKAPDIDMQQVTVGQRSPGGPRVVETPAGVDPGFGYAPGASAMNGAPWSRPFVRAVEPTIGVPVAASSQWMPLITDTAIEYGRPAKIPMQRTGIERGPRLEKADDIIASLRELLGADTRTFDVHGLPLTIDAQWLGQHIADRDPARSVYLPFLLDLVSDPWEVWVTMDRHTSGAVRIRSRLIKGYDLGKGKSLVLVADDAKGAFAAWTFIPTSQMNSANKRRRGLLWWPHE